MRGPKKVTIKFGKLTPEIVSRIKKDEKFRIAIGQYLNYNLSTVWSIAHYRPWIFENRKAAMDFIHKYMKKHPLVLQEEEQKLLQLQSL